VIKLSSSWQRWQRWLPAATAMVSARFGDVPGNFPSKTARAAWGSVTRKRALVGLVAGATAAALAIALTGLASSSATSASVSAAVAAHAGGCVPEPVPAKASLPAPLKADVDTLIGQYYAYSQGLFVDTHWRQAVAISAMEAYRDTTGDTTYDYTFDNPELNNMGLSFFENGKNDDTAWWGLALLQAYSITCYPKYLQDAMDIANYIGKTWDTKTNCGEFVGRKFVGGVPWARSGPQFGYTSAIQNGLFLELTAWLHNTIVEDGGKDHTYLNWAKREWTFIKEVGLFHANTITTPRGFVGPTKLEAYWVPNSSPDIGSNYSGKDNSKDFDDLCGGLRYRIFTYNQGVLIAGLVQLYQATGTLADLTDAEYIATAVVETPTPSQIAFAAKAFHTGKSPWIFTVHGVLIEPEDMPAFSPTCCIGDGAAFKGIFVRDLRMLDDTIASPSTPKGANAGFQCTATYDGQQHYHCTTMYNDFFVTQACSIEAKDTSDVSGYTVNSASVSVPGQDYYLGDHWTGPSEPYSVYAVTQVSGVEALVAADNLPDHGPRFPDCQPARPSSVHQTQRAPSSNTLRAAQTCYQGWYPIPGCREAYDFGRYLVPGYLFYARYEQSSPWRQPGAQQQWRGGGL
jgi:predicted alpha-1,6-mannanase (GH76 family)